AIAALDPELREGFLAEATELFERIEGLVLELGMGDDDERLGELARCYHTLKGTAGSVGLEGLSRAIHDLEDRLRGAGGKIDPELLRRLEQSLGVIETTLRDLRGHNPPHPDDHRRDDSKHSDINKPDH